MSKKFWTDEMDADLLAYVEGHTQQQAADYFGVTHRAVRSHIYLLQLRKALKDGTKPPHKRVRHGTDLPVMATIAKEPANLEGEIVNGDPTHHRFEMRHVQRATKRREVWTGYSSLGF
jgi:hypothetical protein